MKVPKTPWAQRDSSKGILFFAQSMHELLFDYSWDNHRARALDTAFRLREAIVVARDVRHGRISSAALDPIVAELSWSLTADPICQRILGADIQPLIHQIKSKSSDARVPEQRFEFIVQELSKRYKACCEEELVKIISDGKEKERIFQISSLYVSHLINTGFNRRYIFRKVKDTFYDYNVKVADRRMVRKFFSQFSNKDREFTVYIKSDRRFSEIVRNTFGWKVLKKDSDVRKSVRDHADHFFKLGKSQAYIVADIESCLDEDAARQRVERILNLTQSMCYMALSGTKPQIDKSMYVVRGRKHTGAYCVAPTVPLSRRLALPFSVSVEQIGRTTAATLRNFESSSTGRFFRSLNTYALAHRSPDPENQLVSVWAAIEVLLSNPAKDMTRIKHYESLLVPCVCYRYLWRHFEVLHRSLKHVFRASLDELLDEEPVGDQPFEKLAAVLALDGREELRRKLCALCAGNPLALYRLWQLNKNVSKPESILTFLEGHEKRVSWQIQRIYRIRNTLVHSGTQPSFLETATMNLDEYFRVSWSSIVEWPVAEGTKTTIDQVVTNIGLNHELHKETLRRTKGLDRISENDFLRFFGRRTSDSLP